MTTYSQLEIFMTNPSVTIIHSNSCNPKSVARGILTYAGHMQHCSHTIPIKGKIAIIEVVIPTRHEIPHCLICHVEP